MSSQLGQDHPQIEVVKRRHEDEGLLHLQDGEPEVLLKVEDEEEDGLHYFHLGKSLHGLPLCAFSSDAKVSTSDGEKNGQFHCS